MNGIDISRHQPGIDLSKVPCDFVIIKATQGTSFVSPTFRKQIAQAESLGKYLGVYHYAGGGGAIPEAEHFIKTVKEYVGKAILVLDWEGDDNPNFKNPSYANAFLAYVKQMTNITPFIYMSKSVCRQYASQWSPMYPLWCAQYANKKTTGYQDNPWTDDKGFGPWDHCAILQYSSTGRLTGYGANLDLDKAYFTPAEWEAYAKGDHVSIIPSPAPPTLKRGDKNEYVKSWQVFLSLHGYDCGPCDSIFGKRTEQAVKQWQRDHINICKIVDGIIGPNTWASAQSDNL